MRCGSSDRWSSAGVPIRSLAQMTELPTFDFAAFVAAVDGAHRDRGVSWYEFADALWQQSSELNARRDDHPLWGGALARLGARDATAWRNARKAVRVTQWLRRPAAEFIHPGEW